MAELKHLPPGNWANFHATVFRTVSDYRVIVGDTPDDRPDAHFAATAACLKLFIGEAMTQQRAITTAGTSWSFSALLDGEGAILETVQDQAVFNVDRAMLAPSSTLDPGLLVLASGGTKIATLNMFLEGQVPERSLHTTGSYNGQSVAGMMGTGVHGSALGYGPFHNHVRGVHLVTDDHQSVWIERGPEPIFDDGFVARFADRRVNDEALFEAALVHLGGLGIANAVALKVRPRLRVDVVRAMKSLDRDDILLLQSGDYRGFAKAMGHDRTPYYIELTLDPFNPFRDGAHWLASDTAVTLYFEDTAEKAGIVESAAAVYGASVDSLQQILKAAETYLGAQVIANADAIPPPALPIAFLAIARFDALRQGYEANKRWGEVCGAFQRYQIGETIINLHNDAFAVPRGRLLDALTAVRNAFPLLAGGHLVATVRFVNGSRGTMAFTRFPETVVINLDGLRTAKSRAAVAQTRRNFDSGGIPFSQHWGKMGVITHDRLVREFGDPYVPGTRFHSWRRARETLVPPSARAVFHSKAFDDWGLV